jgi:hypothetical protein
MPIVEEIDFNGQTVTEENGQSETTVEEPTQVEAPEPAEETKAEVEEQPKTEAVESLPDWAKEKITKLETEKENYKKGMLKYKKYSLEPEKKDTEEIKLEEETPEWDDDSKKFQKQTLTKAEKIAEERVRAIIEQNNEKAAISQFLSKNSGLEDKWNDIVSNYSPKNGKDTIESILKDLDRALFLTKYESGELTPKDSKEKESVSKLADMSTVSKTTGKSIPKSSTLSQSAIKLAEKMRVDVKQLAQEDDSPYAEIKL